MNEQDAKNLAALIKEERPLAHVDIVSGDFGGKMLYTVDVRWSEHKRMAVPSIDAWTERKTLIPVSEEKR